MKEIIFFSDKNTVSLYANTPPAYDTERYCVHFLSEWVKFNNGEQKRIGLRELIRIIRRSSILLIQDYSLFSSGEGMDSFFYNLILFSRIFALKIIHTKELLYLSDLTEEKKDKRRFAIFLSERPRLSVHDISFISSRNSLEPIFISSRKWRRISISRRFSRSLFAKIHLPESRRELSSTLSDCSFSLCENSEDALLSLSLGTPSYLCADEPPARLLLSRILAYGRGQSFILPFTKRHLEKIEKVGCSDSDLSLFVNFLSELEKSRLRNLIR